MKNEELLKLLNEELQISADINDFTLDRLEKIKQIEKEKLNTDENFDF